MRPSNCGIDWQQSVAHQDTTVHDFLHRLDDGRLEQGFLQELRALAPHHRREVCEILQRRAEAFLVFRAADRALRKALPA